MNRKRALGRIAWILGGSIFWLLFVLRFGSPHLTLSPGWSDAVSHLYATQIFWDHGTELMRRPTKEFSEPLAPGEARELATTLDLPEADFHRYRNAAGSTSIIYYVWPEVPRPYPPGLYLGLSPLSWAMKQGWISPHTALAVLTFALLLLAHAAAILFYALLRDGGARLGPALLFSAFAYFESVRWSLNSQYEILAVFFALAGLWLLKRARPTPAFGAFSLALFLHLRTMYLAPVMAWTLWRRLSTRQRPSGSEILICSVSALMILAAGLTLYWNGPYFRLDQLYDLNALHFSKLGLNPPTLIAASGLTLLSAYWLRGRQWLALAGLATITLLLLQSRLLREWYVMLLFPAAVIAIDPQRRWSAWMALAFYVFFAAVFMNNSPFEFRLFREALALLS